MDLTRDKMLKTGLLFIIVLLTLNNLAAGLYYGDETVPYSARLLSRYISYTSVTGNETAAGIYLSDLARDKGFVVEILTDEPGSFNFTASLYPLSEGKPNIVFLNHIDVVPADDRGEYTYPPFSGTIADGKVWGRGSIDMKGMAIMQLLALQNYIELAAKYDLPLNFTMLSVSGEETGGMTGAKIISDQFIDLLNPVVVYGEGGTGIRSVCKRDQEQIIFGVSVTFKRRLWLHLTLRQYTPATGRGETNNYVHEEMVEALIRLTQKKQKVHFSEQALTMFHELGKLEGGFKGLMLKNSRLFRPLVVPAMKHNTLFHTMITNSINITGINTIHGPHYSSGQSITATLDCRLLPGVDTDRFIKDVIRTINNSAIELTVLHEDNNAAPTDPDQYFNLKKQALKKVFPGSAVIPVLFPAANDNNYFRIHNIPAYGVLPACLPVHLIETIHNVDERLPIEALEKGLKVYVHLIKLILDSANEEQNQWDID